MLGVRSRLVIIGAALAASATVVAACGGSSASEASTPSHAPTVANTALQTDSNGNTLSAASGTGAGGGSGSTASNPAAVAGKAVFEANCQGCHAADGTQAGVGPKLQGLGLAQARIELQVTNGGAVMPAFGKTLSKTDFKNVVAYVLSIQNQ